MLSVIVLFAVVLSQCSDSNVEIHREWRELSPENQESYLRAVACLRSRPNRLTAERGFPRPRTRYDDFAYIHFRGAGDVHGTPQFPPWHRVMLRVFDKALKEECNYEGPFPYTGPLILKLLKDLQSGSRLDQQGVSKHPSWVD